VADAVNIPATRQQLEQRLLSLLLQQVPLLSLANVTLACGVSYAMMARLDALFIGLWLVVVTLTSASRWWIVRTIAQRNHNSEITTDTLRRFTTLSLAIGLCWGLLCAGCVLTAGLNAALIPLLCIAGLVAGSASGTCSHVRAFAGYCIAAMLPIIIALLVHGGSDALLLAIFASLHLGFTLRTGTVNNRHLCQSIVDNLELEQAREQATRLARHLRRISTMDAVTGLVNRRGFDQSIDAEYRRARRASAPLCLIMCDLDFFKNYNDSLGHQAGDKCLHEVAAALQQRCSRAGDVVARFGGEEFAIISPNTTVAQAEMFASIICQVVYQLQLPHPASNASDFVTISAGVAVYHEHNYREIKDFIEAADQALYQAKANGRNQACLAGKGSKPEPLVSLAPVS